MARNDPQLNLRLPADLKEMLEEAAVKNNRTLTAETVDRLISSFSAGTNPANVVFLMARMEMRAAEAELDVIQLKMMLLETALALTGAIKQVPPGETKSQSDLASKIEVWKKTVSDAFEHVGELSQNPSELKGTATKLKDAALKKMDELDAAVKNAKKSLDEVSRQEDGNSADSNNDRPT